MGRAGGVYRGAADPSTSTTWMKVYRGWVSGPVRADAAGCDTFAIDIKVRAKQCAAPPLHTVAVVVSPAAIILGNEQVSDGIDLLQSSE